MKELANTKGLSTEEWLALRKKGIGGSDAGAILGVNPWRSAMDVYVDKIHPEEVEEKSSEAMMFGSFAEEYVAKRFEQETGKKVRNRNAILQHDDYPWMIADLDRVVVGEKALLECKTTNAFNGKAWDNDDVPPSYLVQVMHYLAVTGYEKAYVACLIGNSRFVIREIERDDDAITALINAEKDFWENHVLAGVMPDPDGSTAASTLIKDMYPEGAPKKEIQLTGQYDMQRYDEICSMIKRLETEKKEREQQMQMEMEDAEIGWIGHRKVTWSTRAPRVTVDSKKLKKDYPDVYEATKKVGKSYRVFKVSEPEEEEE